MGVGTPAYRSFVVASICLHVVLLYYFPMSRFEHFLSRGTVDEIGIEGDLSVEPLETLRRTIDIEVIEFELARESQPEAATETREQPQIVEEAPAPEEVEVPEPQPVVPVVARPAVQPGPPAEAPDPAGGTGTMGSDTPDATVLPPVLVAVVWPDAPPEARRRRETPVKLRVHVTAAGEVSQVQVVEPTGCQPCEEAAMEAARRLRFRPAMRGATPVDAWVSYTVSFKR